MPSHVLPRLREPRLEALHLLFPAITKLKRRLLDLRSICDMQRLQLSAPLFEDRGADS